MDVRQCKKTVVGGYDKITQHGKAYAESSHSPMDSGHDGHRQICHLRHKGMNPLVKPLESFPAISRTVRDDPMKELNIAARHESRAGSLQHHAAHRAAAGHFVHCGHEISPHLSVERVPALGTVEHDLVNSAFLLGQKVLHAVSFAEDDLMALASGRLIFRFSITHLPNYPFTNSSKISIPWMHFSSAMIIVSEQFFLWHPTQRLLRQLPKLHFHVRCAPIPRARWRYCPSNTHGAFPRKELRFVSVASSARSGCFSQKAPSFLFERASRPLIRRRYTPWNNSGLPSIVLPALAYIAWSIGPWFLNTMSSFSTTRTVTALKAIDG